MAPIDRDALCAFVNVEIERFHQARLDRLAHINLQDVLRKKNPYLFKAKNIATAEALITGIMDAFLSSSEEKIFGDFLEELAVFISAQTSGGRKSSAAGLDLEFDRDDRRYLVSVKSGPNWGNSSQYAALRTAFGRAVTVQRQGHHGLAIQPVLGICYGKARTVHTNLYMKIMGQSFWHFLSGDRDLYVEIIEPIGYRAREHNDDFAQQRAALVNRFTHEFIELFCGPDYQIDWCRLVTMNSGNLTDPA